MYTDLPIRLSLDECVRLLQINPAHFCSATADPIAYSPCSPGCDDLWAERAYNGAPLARESLARAILYAEIDVEKAVGAPLTPKGRTRMVDAPDYRDPRGGYRYVVGEHLREYWPRHAVKIATADVQMLDLDEDGLEEVAQIAFATPATFDPETLVFYVVDQFDSPPARIWPPKRVVEDAGVVTVQFDCWQVIDRRLLLLPKLVVVNLLSSDSYITAIDVGVMVEDRSQPSVTYVYDDPNTPCNSPDCAACTDGVAYGILQSDGDSVVAWPARFDEDTSSWVKDLTISPCSCLRFPRSLHITTYHSFCPPTPRNELCDPIRWIVALLAGARVQIGHCECDCTGSAWFRGLQKDHANAFGTRYMSSDALACPFGTRAGEQQAYSALRSAIGIVVKHATV